MVWNLIVAGKIAASLAVSDDFVDWLLPRLKDPRTRYLDPYADTRIGGAQLGVWIAEIERVAEELRIEARARAESRGRWPRDPDLRLRLIHEAAERALKTAPEYAKLGEVIAILQLAEQRAAHIDAIGD